MASYLKSNVFSDVYIGGNCIVKGNISSLGGSITSQWTTTGSAIYYTTGNVGIGTNNPTGSGSAGSLLHIADSTSANPTVHVDASVGTGQARLHLRSGTGSTNRASRIDFFNNVLSSTVPQWTIISGYDQNGTNDMRYVNYAGAITMAWAQNGNIGIGTTNPGSLLTVSGGVGIGSGYNAFTAPTGGLIVQGNVGIGTTNPGVNALQVTGNVVTQGFTSNATNTVFNFDTLTVPFLNATQVGIGTTAPDNTIDAVGSIVIAPVTFIGASNYGVFFRRGFSTSNFYNCSVMAYDHSGDTYPDGISINGYDGVSICTGANTRQERVRVLGTNGYVGIGTTNPSGTLDVRGTSMYVGNQVNSAAASGATSNANIVLSGAGNNPITGSLPSIYHRGYVGLGLCADYAISFEVNANTSRADAMRITATGLVGIGTTSPNWTLSTQYAGGNDSSTTPALNFAAEICNTTASGANNRTNLLLFTDSNSTQGAIGAYRRSYNADYTGGLIFYVGSQPSGYTQGRPTTTTQASASLTEAMRITYTGNVGIGTTSPGYVLQVNSAATGTETVAAFLKPSMATGGTSAFIQVGGAIAIGGAGAMGFLNYGTNASNVFQLSLNGSGGSAININSTGVGIGTTSPQAFLDVRNSALIGDYGGSGFYNPNAALHIRRSGVNPHLIFENIGVSTGALAGISGGMVYACDGSTHAFRTGCTITGDMSSTGTERMRINTTGVGIGTAVPTRPFHLYGSMRLDMNVASYSTQSATQVWTGGTWYQLVAPGALTNLAQATTIPTTYLISMTWQTTANNPYNLYCSFLYNCGWCNDVNANQLSGAPVPTSYHATNNAGDFQVSIRGNATGSNYTGFDFKVNTTTTTGYWVVKAMIISYY